MNVLFVECEKPSPIRVKLSLPFAYLSIASYVRSQEKDVQFSFHSYQLDHLAHRPSVDIDSLTRRHAAAVVMAGACTSTFPRTARLLKNAKRAGCCTILGGLFPTYNARGVLEEHPEIDYVVVGDGEIPCRDLLAALRSGDPVDEISGIGYRNSDGIVINSVARAEAPRLPLLDLSGIDVGGYQRTYQRHYLFGGRGCQHRCNFCTVRRGGRVLLRPVEDVLLDARALLAAFGPHVASLADANITTHKAYYGQLLTALCTQLPAFRVSVKGRIDELDAEYIRFLKDVNVSSLAVGWETPIVEQLESVRKTTRGLIWTERFRALLLAARMVGLDVHVNVMLGMPGECEASLEAKVDLVSRLHREFGVTPFLSFFTPHPGSQIHRALERYRMRIIDGNLENYDHLHPVVVPVAAADGFVDSMWSAYGAIASETKSEATNPPREHLQTLSVSCLTSAMAAPGDVPVPVELEN